MSSSKPIVCGESTRPHAAEADAREELARVPQLVRVMRDAWVALSVDTSKDEVMRSVLAKGVSIINDVNASQARGAIDDLAKSFNGIALMHMQGTPRTIPSIRTATTCCVKSAKV